LAKKTRTVYTCQSCGWQSGKWMGRCPECGAWESLVEEVVVPAAPRRGTPSSGEAARARLLRYDEIDSQADIRSPSGCPEFDRVLGGGVVPGSLVLIGGEPGVGKSTLLLQVAATVAAAGQTVLYVSGEESERQLKLRGQRLGLAAPELYIMPETQLEQIEAEVQRLRPALVVADSIQTIYTAELDSAPGNISQIRECATRFLYLAKSSGIPFFLIGHITKEGAIAGPKALEHIVDTVLYFEGERHHNHRIVRAVKNRFGATSEVAIYEMTDRGMREVANPSALFLAERPAGVAGTAVICSMEGTRPILVEVQSLVSQSNFSAGRRMTQGFDRNRISLLLAMLERVAGLNLLGADVYVNMAGGMQVDEPAADLGVVAAIVSSWHNRPLPAEAVFIGEVGLAGEVRAVPHGALRVREAATMGFGRCFLPAGNLPLQPAPKDLDIVPVKGINQLLDQLF